MSCFEYSGPRIPTCIEASSRNSPSSAARRSRVPWVYGAPKYVSHVSRWASKCTSATGPCLRCIDRRSGRTTVWSPPMLTSDAGPLEHLVRPTLDLGDRLHDVERVARDVAGVGALEERERLHLVDRMELRPEHPRGLPDRARAEPGAGTEAHAGVERDPEDRDVATVEVAELGESDERRGARVPGHDRAADRLDRGLAVRDVTPSLGGRSRMLAPAPLRRRPARTGAEPSGRLVG